MASMMLELLPADADEAEPAIFSVWMKSEALEMEVSITKPLD